MYARFFFFFLNNKIKKWMKVFQFHKKKKKESEDTKIKVGKETRIHEIFLFFFFNYRSHSLRIQSLNVDLSQWPLVYGKF